MVVVAQNFLGVICTEICSNDLYVMFGSTAWHGFGCRMICSCISAVPWGFGGPLVLPVGEVSGEIS